MAQNRKDNYQDNDFVRDNEPFKNDLLDREKIAQLWQDTLLKSDKHFVMAVDASWGMGKTYFARNWECKLLHDDYKVCYIDAFEYDFTDDPFMTITSNLIEAFEFTELEEVSNKLNTFFRAFKGHLGAAVPALVGGVVKIVSTIPQIGGIADIGSSLTNATAKAVKETKNKSMNPADEVLQSDLSYNAAMTQFKNKLKELIKKQNSDKPLIVIVDELDRCKPTYAIEFLEKLKHLFDVPNMIFILFINEKELASAISHTYGVNGSDYLGKFIQVSAKFKFNDASTNNFRDYLNNYFITNKQLIVKYSEELCYDLIEICNYMYHIYNTLSFRDIDNIIVSLNLLDLDNSYHIGLFVILKIIQLKDKSLYNIITNPEKLKDNYDKFMPDKLKQIEAFYSNNIIISMFILLCRIIATLNSGYSSFWAYNHASDEDIKIERLMEENAKKFHCTNYIEYLTMLTALSDLNTNNTGDI